MTSDTKESGNIEVYLQELQPVIDLLSEEKYFGAESICEIIESRYPDEESGIDQDCKTLLKDIKKIFSDDPKKSLELVGNIKERYQKLKEKYL